MPKHNIPVYAIVELLMLLAQYDKNIGEYRGHNVRNGYVIVKTSSGSITFSQELIMKQFSDPENVTKNDLMNTISFFRRQRTRQRSA